MSNGGARGLRPYVRNFVAINVPYNSGNASRNGSITCRRRISLQALSRTGAAASGGLFVNAKSLTVFTVIARGFKKCI